MYELCTYEIGGESWLIAVAKRSGDDVVMVGLVINAGLAPESRELAEGRAYAWRGKRYWMKIEVREYTEEKHVKRELKGYRRDGIQDRFQPDFLKIRFEWQLSEKHATLRVTDSAD